jgi:hypothetical protein
VGAADYDGDGDLDLAIANWENQNNSLYDNRSQTGHWLRVRCESQALNRWGIGARVRLVYHSSDRDRLAVRHIETGFGFRSQSEPVAHFGLSDAEVVDTLQVVWPSGHTDTFEAVESNQTVIVSEGEGIIARHAPEPPPEPLRPLDEQAYARLETADAGDSEALLDSLCAQEGDAFDCSEAAINAIGYRLLYGAHPEAALSVLQANAARHPASTNAWDSVAEACAALGDTAGVLTYTQKVLEVIDRDVTLDDTARRLLRNGAGYRLKSYR